MKVLHIGNDVSVPLDEIIMILNERSAMDATRDYIVEAKKKRRFINCRGTVKSFVFVRERGREVVYASPIASSTLQKRISEELSYKWLSEVAVFTAILEK